MTLAQLVERLRGYGYDGPVSRKSVKEFLDGPDAPDLDITDTAGKSLGFDDIIPKGITLTVTPNDAEADTVTVEDGTAEAPGSDDEGMEELQADLKSVRNRLRAIEAKDGIDASGKNGVESKSATDRWNFKTENPARAMYRKSIERGTNLSTKAAPVFDSADEAEVAGAWFRLKAADASGGRHYGQRSRDVEIVKGAVSYDASRGGSFVPPPAFEATVIELLNDYGAARKLVPFKPTPIEGAYQPRWDSDLSMTWNTEGATLADQDPATSSVFVRPKKLTGYIKLTRDMIEADASGIADQCFRSFARAAANKEDAAFFSGDGTSTYGGIVGILNAIGSAATVTSTNTTWATLVDGDVQTMMGKIADFAGQGSLEITCTRSGFFEIFNRLNVAKGGITYQEAANGQVIYKVLGHDVILNNIMPTTTATSTVSAYFGDFAMGIKAGQYGTLEFAQSDQRYFDEDSIALRVIERVDINCHDLGDSSNRGPISALSTGS